MDPLIRRWLAKTPVLLTAYLAWMNRGRLRGRKGLAAALILFVAWTATVSTFMRLDRTAAISALEWLHRHDLFWATISTVTSVILVSRRRVLNKIAASRSWTAALPVEPSTANWQALATDSAPALFMAIILAAGFGSLSLLALVTDGTPTPLITWAAMTGGVILGAGLSYLLPAGRQEEVYESSRYVPSHRRAVTQSPTGSLSALGFWPVRQMFGSARPKTIARAMMPIMLSIPMGSTAADAMGVIGLLFVIGAVVLLVASAISVSAKASRWLKPLPLKSDIVARRIFLPVFAFMSCMTLIESWLLWVLGSSIARGIAIGALTLIASMACAVTGSLFAIVGNDKPHP